MVSRSAASRGRGAECLAGLPGVAASQIPLLLCLAEENRPGRIQGLDQTLVQELSQRLGIPQHPSSAVITNGRVGGVEAIRWAGEFIDQGYPYCLVAGVDTFLVGETLATFEAQRRLRTSQNSDGFIPGEAGAAVLLGPAGDQPPKQVRCLGIGFGRERATVDSEEPLRADGLAAALRAALADAGCTYDDVDYRLTDASGEQYVFKEAALAIARTMQKVKAEFDIWHPADCIGEVGAAVVPIVLSVAKMASDKGYAPGAGVLCHFGNDEGARAAMIVRHFNERNV